jgi:hypothetical protein
MARRAEEPLEKRLILLFKGDWVALERLLAGRMTPTEFIRRSVRRTIRKAAQRVELTERNTPDVSIE